MQSPTPISAEPTAVCVPFSQASPAQVTQALDTVRQAVGPQFPPLVKGTWANAIRALQPDLWVAPTSVSLDEHDLARLVQHLDALPAIVNARAGHGRGKLFFTRQPMSCPAELLRALTEMEAHPQASGPAVYQLVTGLLRTRAEADELNWAKVPDPREDDGTDPKQARAALLARLAALDRARGVSGPG
ncbi:hypothetical protein ACFP2F_17420 [Hymenobacter artigasi]|uniref:Uncharacterized protein n=1 Tax=Hymenobacter artigasi TaxID=2719616 RepID=A0ABX1HM80_9BACT|nr:hypothetical protein [Hymenobacter artigasi]NKI91359.1 hypothetical protein [Hymenobacter artigasi]